MAKGVYKVTGLVGTSSESVCASGIETIWREGINSC